MNPYKAYQSSTAPTQTRIDSTLSLYEAAIERLHKAAALVEAGDTITAGATLRSVNLIVGALASAVDASAWDLALNLLRLFEFVLHAVASGQPARLAAALQVLRTLHEGYVAIRPEALQLERAGALPPPDRVSSIQLSA